MKLTKSHFFLLLFALVIPLLFSCSSAPVKKNYFIEKSEILKKTELKEYPTQKDYPDADGVVIYENCEREIDKFLNFYSFDLVQKVVKVFKNFSAFSKLNIPLDYGEVFLGVDARIIRSDTNIKVLTNDDIITTTMKLQDEEGEYTKVVKVIFPNVDENVVIEYNYRIAKIGDIFGSSWILQDYEIPKVFSTYKLTAPKEIPVWFFESSLNRNAFRDRKFVDYEKLRLLWSVNLNNIKGNKEPVLQSDEDNNIALWTFKDVPAFIPEPEMPPIRYHIAKIDCNLDYKDAWEKMAANYKADFFNKSIDSTNSYKSLVDSLTVGCKSEVEKIEKLKNYVANIRYEAIELGSNGLKPRKPKKVIETGYGDCKDKSLLLITLLKEINIIAHPAVLLTADKGYINKNFPRWNFNHMIVFCKDSNNYSHWIDPTVTFCPLDEIPWQDEGLYAMIIRDKGDYEFKATPLSSSDKNTTKINLKEKIISDSLARYEVQMEFFGEKDLQYRNRFYAYNNDDRNQAITSLLNKEFISSKIDSLKFSDFNDLKTPFKINFQFESENFVTKQGNIYFFNYDVIRRELDMELPNSKERLYPIFNEFPFQTKTSIEIEYPSNLLTVNALPDRFKLYDENYEYEKRFVNVSTSKISSDITYLVKNSMIMNDKYKDVKNFFSKVNNADKSRIIFNKIVK